MRPTQFDGSRRWPEKAGRLPRYHLLLYGPERSGGSAAPPLGLMFLATENRTSTAAACRRMRRSPAAGPRFSDPATRRQPLVFGEKGREYFDRLANRTPERFERLELSFDEYAELDALQAVIGDVLPATWRSTCRAEWCAASRRARRSAPPPGPLPPASAVGPVARRDEGVGWDRPKNNCGGEVHFNSCQFRRVPRMIWGDQ